MLAGWKKTEEGVKEKEARPVGIEKVSVRGGILTCGTERIVLPNFSDSKNE